MKYFTLKEFTRSVRADRLGIDNSLPPELAGCIEALVAHVLDPLREAYGKPIYITSGYRCPALNKAVGGSGTSDHVLGRAADIVGAPVTRDENRKLYGLILLLGLPFDQLIWEQGDKTGPDWVHVSYRAEGNRHQLLKL